MSSEIPNVFPLKKTQAVGHGVILLYEVSRRTFLYNLEIKKPLTSFSEPAINTMLPKQHDHNILHTVLDRLHLL